MNIDDIQYFVRDARSRGETILGTSPVSEPLIRERKAVGRVAQAVYEGVMDLPLARVKELLQDADLDQLMTDWSYGTTDRDSASSLTVALTQRAPEKIAYLLQDSMTQTKKHRLLERWWNVVSPYRFPLPVALHGAVLHIFGADLAQIGRVGDSTADHLKSTLDHLGCGEAPIVAAARWIADIESRGWDDRIGIAGGRVALRDLIETYGEALVPMIPWLLASANDTETRFLADLVVSVTAAGLLIEEIAAAHELPGSTRAQGLMHIIEHGSGEGRGDLARWASDTSMFLLPAPLAAPSSIWLDDVVLEAAIRDAVNAAVDVLRTKGLSKEDQITGALLTLLRDRLSSVARRGPGRSGHRGLDLTAVTTTSSGKAGEKVHGADLGILLSVDVPGRLNTRQAHLVQVKRPPVRKRDSTPPSWKIDTEQLRNLLDHDNSATYWLVTEIPNHRILCVPARYLEARSKARPVDTHGAPGDAFILHYDAALSSATIPLGQLLVDLVIGMWLGNTSERAIAVAEGRDTDYEPGELLHLTLGVRNSDRG